MARARNIKPGFFKNEDLAECTPWARLCFAGLWTLADREGRLEDRPKRIKGELFAFDTIEVEPLLAELQQRNFILRYTDAEGRNLIQVLEFLKHQNPHHREPPSELAPPQSPGLLPHAIPPKPEAQAASHDAQASVLPQAGPGLAPPRSDLARGPSRADSGILIPDTGEIPPQPPKGEGRRSTGSGEGRFPDFWVAWPNTDRKADRKKCLAKWQRHGWDAIADEIVAHVAAMKATRKWRDGFEPAPLTYLNGERWRDGVNAPDRGTATAEDEIFEGLR